MLKRYGDVSLDDALKPITNYNMQELYLFLIDEGVFEKDEVDMQEFSNCIYQANIKKLRETTKSWNKLKLALKTLKEFYQDDIQKHKRINPTWYLRCCESVNLSPQDMGKMKFKDETKVKFQREMKKRISIP